MEDRFLHTLFSPFTRDVGNPARKAISNFNEFQWFVESNSGSSDCFCEVYPSPYTTLGSIFYDMDGPQAIPEAQGFYSYLMNDRHIPTIPVDSGRKGVHLHALVKPRRFESVEAAKKSLAATALMLLIDYSKKPLTSIDTHVIGDVRRFCRIPNTLRPDGNNWCTYLPPDFHHMTETEVMAHRKSPHTYDYKLPPRQLQFINAPNDEVTSYLNRVLTSQVAAQTTMKAITPPDGKILRFLRGVMRPCLFKAFTESNPRHHTRVASVVDLKGAGFSAQEIETYISQLHWIDYDPATTHIQVSHIFTKTYIPYSCRTLQTLGVCDGKHL